MAEAAFLAVDWGTTNRRVYAIGHDGAVVATGRDDRGVLAVGRDGFPAETAAIRRTFGDLPMLCAGMVGSSRGWAEVPYLACPADLPGLTEALYQIDARTAIVPGLSYIDGARADIMRGEEVQLLGSFAAGLVSADSQLCQPGTHCKWARLGGGRLTDFRTTMTGEIFALLKRDSLLAEFIGAEVDDDDAFRAGLAAAQNGTLLGDLFAIRAACLLGRREPESAAAYVSGLLIGTDIRERAMCREDVVYICASPPLDKLYTLALASIGVHAVAVDSHVAFVAGITEIWRLSRARAS